MKNIKLSISALNASNTCPGNYVLVLQAIKCTRSIAIIIGLQEAQAIAAALEKIKPAQPLPQDILLDTLLHLNAHLQHVNIGGFKKGSFLSSIIIKDNSDHVFEIECRTSDAVAMASRQECPIYINEDLLNELAMAAPAEEKIISGKCGQLEEYSLEELYDILSKLLANEDYETASRVRDIICKKKENKPCI